MTIENKIICLENGKLYSSIRKAALDTHMRKEKVSSILKGEMDEYKGYSFIYFDNVLEQLNNKPSKEFEKFKAVYVKRIEKLNNIIVSSVLQFDEDKNFKKLLPQLIKAQKISQELVLSIKQNLE